MFGYGRFMAVDGKLIVLSYNPTKKTHDRESLRTHLNKNMRAMLDGRRIEFFVYYIADSNEDADKGRELFTSALAGKLPKRKPSIAELLDDKPKKRSK